MHVAYLCSVTKYINMQPGPPRGEQGKQMTRAQRSVGGPGGSTITISHLILFTIINAVGGAAAR